MQAVPDAEVVVPAADLHEIADEPYATIGQAGVESPHLSFALCDCRQKVQLSDCLQIHTIELPKYNFDERSIGTADPLVQWAFFLSRAAEFEATELKRMLPDRAYVKAAGVMEMIGITPPKSAKFMKPAARQEARQEALEEGRQEGLEKGLEKGRQVGRQEGRKLGLVEQVRLLQSLLHEPVSPETELLALDLDALARLCGDLKGRVLPS